MVKGVVTVVVPIYNVEKYLNRCLDSIIKQTYGNLEIILVDDESPDDCPRMCEEWAKKDERIKVVHKKNEGLGMARNTGIENATGEFICFFDSDDYIDIDTIKKTYYRAINDDADIVMFGLNSVDSFGNVLSSEVPNTDKELYVDEEIINFIVPNMIAADPDTGKKLNLNMSSSGRLFSMELIIKNCWRFVSEREYISEDFYSLLDLYKYVKRVSIIREALYYYCYNSTSLSHSYNSDRFKRVCECHKAMISICNNNGYPEQVKICLDSQYIGSVICTMKLLIMSTSNKKEKKRYIYNIVNDAYLQCIIKKMNINNETNARKIIITIMRLKLKNMICFLVKCKC